MYWGGSKGSYLSCFVVSELPGLLVSYHINLGNISVIIVLHISSVYFSVFWFSHCAWKLSRFSCVWLTQTVGTVTFQTPLSMGLSKQEYWCGLPCLQGIFPTEIEPLSPKSPALAGRFLTTSATWEAHSIPILCILNPLYLSHVSWIFCSGICFLFNLFIFRFAIWEFSVDTSSN